MRPAGGQLRGAQRRERTSAVVIDSARQVLWACFFHDGVWAPEEITLPEDLHTVPATSDAEHGHRLHRWEQHITSSL